MDKDFVDIIQRMAREQGKEVLVNGKAKTYLGDYCEGRFKKEANIFRQILDAGCGEHINNADNVPDRKGKLMKQLEDDNGLSPKVTAGYLDLLGLILKGDISKREEATMSVPSGNMVHILGGTFTMGSSVREPERSEDEIPHQVTISSFYMGKFPVTQAEYQAVTGTNPSEFRGDNLPMENVSWYEAIEYCNSLSQREGLLPAYAVKDGNVEWKGNGYRLPTEAEWEYACRAGTSTLYNSGTSVDNAGWYDGNSDGMTHPVGEKQENAWGLCDMHGNVFEWCWDWYRAYSSIAQTDPRGMPYGSHRILRGGSWISSAQELRSAGRYFFPPSIQRGNIGFRIVRSGKVS